MRDDIATAAQLNEYEPLEPEYWQKQIAVNLARVAEALEEALEARPDDFEAAFHVMESSYHNSNQRLQECRLALEAAVRTLRAFHGEPAWDLYYRYSPELAKVRAVLGPECNLQGKM